MKQPSPTPPESIEIRSAKVRNIIAGRPPLFARIGTLVIAAIMTALIAMVMAMEWPHGTGESVWQHLIGNTSR